MVLTEPLTILILVVFKKTFFSRIFSTNSRQKKSLVMTNTRKHGLYKVRNRGAVEFRALFA